VENAKIGKRAVRNVMFLHIFVFLKRNPKMIERLFNLTDYPRCCNCGIESLELTEIGIDKKHLVCDKCLDLWRGFALDYISILNEARRNHTHSKVWGQVFRRF
jgi:hypothetical protein